MNLLDELIPTAIKEDAAKALKEDVGDGDITARLISPDARATAHVITREPAVICGQAWVNEVFHQVDSDITIEWQVNDGDRVEADSRLFTVTGNARSLLTAERPALNFLQTLSGTATIARYYADKVAHTHTRILDTRKTLPGLRVAQKYAIRCGGCHNHRIGLWDAFLIKENHIMACGSISQAVATAKQIAPGKPVEVEVETIQQLEEAISAGADIIMLDNFDLKTMARAVDLADKKVKLEASGGISDETLVAIAETGVDFISIGALTKHCQAIDLSMRIAN
ncbi:nicotinate-nucleotide diphosphorylase (carboxylating) [Hahella sp. CCB-MM4]|uniref:carboxylating nicotinate-nucleotide diphosphorylase n=1 Tax=Hahella sp. (strain CCB-MM4) TaxID=1926491 RepID=UPI000B9A929D|nr:carboxylating nicotinate-nucleotide diphosphorylase [Hahella sp. CCB-MM4]OZG72496.1 nicotinate-nucleotide diphosphorylase (carboxylating) [Hahella sp. CCB-MM4]